MSSQLFRANILNAISKPVAHCLKGLLAVNQDSDYYRELDDIPVRQVDLALFTEEDLTTLQIETGTSVDFEFFEHVYQILEAAGAEFQDVTLFDSSTGTHHVFESIFDLDIEFDISYNVSIKVLSPILLFPLVHTASITLFIMSCTSLKFNSFLPFVSFAIVINEIATRVPKLELDALVKHCAQTIKVLPKSSSNLVKFSLISFKPLEMVIPKSPSPN